MTTFLSVRRLYLQTTNFNVGIVRKGFAGSTLANSRKGAPVQKAGPIDRRESRRGYSPLAAFSLPSPFSGSVAGKRQDHEPRALARPYSDLPGLTIRIMAGGHARTSQLTGPHRREKTKSFGLSGSVEASSAFIGLESERASGGKTRHARDGSLLEFWTWLCAPDTPPARCQRSRHSRGSARSTQSGALVFSLPSLSLFRQRGKLPPAHFLGNFLGGSLSFSLSVRSLFYSMTALSPDEEPNIIAINPAAERELEMRKRARADEKHCPRNHGFVELDEHTRTISCQDCGKVIEAFDYLWGRTVRGEHLLSGLAGIKARIKVATAECADLERRVDNARASLKRVAEPQSQEDRLRFKNDMANADWRARNPSIRVV